jgi:hypothetical protein
MSERRKRPETTLRRVVPSWALSVVFVLQLLNLLQLVLYVPLLALLGQAVLYVLAGHKRQENFFYQLLQLISKPFTFLVRKATPPKVADQHVPVVTFFVLLIVYAVVTFEKISLCLSMGVGACR